MSNRKPQYKDLSKWKATVRRQNKKYYDRHSKQNINDKLRYTKQEEELIMSKEIPDIEIAKLLGRTLRAIQVKRAKLRRRSQSGY